MMQHACLFCRDTDETGHFAALQTALRSSHKGPPAPWLQVAAPLLELHAALAGQCRAPAAGAQLLSLLVSNQAAAGLLAPIARLAASRADAAAYSSDETAAVTAALRFAAAAAALIARQPAATQVLLCSDNSCCDSYDFASPAQCSCFVYAPAGHECSRDGRAG